MANDNHLLSVTLYNVTMPNNKYHLFLCNKLKKFEGKKEENIA